MRFDSNVKFYSGSAEYYDPDKGDWMGKPKLLGEEIANVTEVGTDTSNTDFGNIATRSLVIRLANPVDFDWSYCTVDDSDTKFVPTTSRNPLKNYTLIVGESND